MIVIFYHQDEGKLYVCKPNERTNVIDIQDPELMNYIPNDDILYVTNAHYYTKQQFADYLSGNSVEEMSVGVPVTQGITTTEVVSTDKKFIHPTANGTVLIEDINTPKYPAGIALNGKWHFIAVDDIGEDVLNNSIFFRLLVKKGKVEVVDAAYVKKNEHKIKTKKSPAELALDKILIPSGIPGTAGKVADAGGLGYIGGDVSVEIEVD